VKRVMNTEYSGRCPFCVGLFQVGIVDDEVPAVTHTLPMCQKFQELDPLQFIIAAREEKERLSRN